MEELYNNEVNVSIHTIDGEHKISDGRLLVNEKGCDLRLQIYVNDESKFNAVVGILENGNILILLNGYFISAIASGIKTETRVRFREVLYSTESNFHDETSKICAQIPSLSKWVPSSLYSLDFQNESTITIIVDREKEFIFYVPFGTIQIYFESFFSAGESLKVSPISYLILNFTESVKKSTANEKFQNVMAFLDCFFYTPLLAKSLRIYNGTNWLMIHTKLYPIMRPITDNDFEITSKISFSIINVGLQLAFNRYFEKEEFFNFIFQSYHDAAYNDVPLNRFLSAFRIFERIGKHIEKEKGLNKEAKEKVDLLHQEFISINGSKKKAKWYFFFFLEFNNLIEMPQLKRLYDLVDLRDSISHGGHEKVQSFSALDVQNMANEINGYVIAGTFSMLGFDKKICNHMRGIEISRKYFDSYSASEYSMAVSKLLHRPI